MVIRPNANQATKTVVQRVTNRAAWSAHRDDAQLGAVRREQEPAQRQGQPDDHGGGEVAHEQPAELRRPVEQHERADAAEREAQDADDLGQQTAAHGLEARRHGRADGHACSAPAAAAVARANSHSTGKPEADEDHEQQRHLAREPARRPPGAAGRRRRPSSPGTRGAAAAITREMVVGRHQLPLDEARDAGLLGRELGARRRVPQPARLALRSRARSSDLTTGSAEAAGAT